MTEIKDQFLRSLSGLSILADLEIFKTKKPGEVLPDFVPSQSFYYLDASFNNIEIQRGGN